MSKKRQPDFELNHDNYDEPLEHIEAGEFQQATGEKISTRKILTAHRKKPSDDNAQPQVQTANPFAAFGGFLTAPAASSIMSTTQPRPMAPLSTTASSVSAAAPFLVPNAFSATGFPSFASNQPAFGTASSTASLTSFGPSSSLQPPALTSASSQSQFSSSFLQSSTSALSSVSTAVAPPPLTFVSATSAIGSSFANAAASRPLGNGASPSAPTSASDANRLEFSEKVAQLNKRLLEHLTRSLEANPRCNLTPVFDDYKRHLGILETRYLMPAPSAPPSGSGGASAVESPAASISTPTSASPFHLSASSAASSLFRSDSSSSASASPSSAPTWSPTLNLNPGVLSSAPSLAKASLAPGPASTGTTTASSATTSVFSLGSPASSSSASSAASNLTFTWASSGSSLTSSGTNNSSGTNPSTSGLFKFGSGTSFGSSNAPAASASSSLFGPASGSGATANFQFGAGAGGGLLAGASPFVFGQTTPAAFGAAGQGQASGQPAAAEDGEGEGGADDPEDAPKPAERVEQREEGAQCSAKCRLRYLRGTDWLDRGSAEEGSTVSVKTCAQPPGVQLVVRQNNTLGTILLNAFLPRASSVEKFSGKNSFSFFAAPNPPLPESAASTTASGDPHKPVRFLLRVGAADLNSVAAALSDAELVVESK